jgi:ComF family protein
VAVCGACWSDIAFISAPYCQCCGTPFEFTVAERSVCGRCLAAPPVYHRARSVVLYDDASRSLLLRFKHGDGLHMTGLFGAWMARAGVELLAEADLLVPVPLHWTRLFTRRYNQAAALVLDLAVRAGVAADIDTLERARRTPSQGSRTRSARARNVQGAFRIAPDARARVKGKRVLLVDDVLTSGATVSACGRVLLRAGAERVDVLTVARVR